MKVTVDENLCIGCGMCVSLLPKVFSFNENSKAKVLNKEIKKELEEKVLECENLCPVVAIKT